MRGYCEPNLATNDPWINLASAIIRSAVDDYIRALKKGDAQNVYYFERWFHSDYFRVYSLGLNPDVIVEKCKRIAKVKKGAMKAS